MTGGLDGDIDVVLCEQTKQLPVRGQVHLSAATITFNNPCCALIGRDHHTADLIVLDRLNKLAVADGVDLGLTPAAVPEIAATA